MDGIKLSSPKPTLNIGGKSTGTTDHNKLKNLDFEHSGHTGFQKVLSQEQLNAIADVGKLKSDMGDVETALDVIIAIQEALIGGES